MKKYISIILLTLSFNLMSGETGELIGIKAKFELVNTYIKELNKENNKVILDPVESGDNTIIFYDYKIYYPSDEFLFKLSKKFNTPLFRLCFYDADYWYYDFIYHDKILNTFSTHPQWTKANNPKSKNDYIAKPDVLIKYWKGVTKNQIEKYLIDHIKNEDLFLTKFKAYKDDEFEYEDVWQVTDFMRKFGLIYPEDE